MVFRETKADFWAMEARWADATHRIELDGKLDYSGPLFRARIEPATFQTEHIEVVGNAWDANPLSLEPCATMYVLLRGLMQSMPHLPTARSMK